MNKLVRNIIILVAAIAVLGGGFWWIMTVEPKVEDSQELTSQTPETVTVYQTDESEITAVNITRADASLEFKKQGEEWSFTGYDNSMVAQTKIKSLVSSISNISSTNHITENTHECGLDTPEVTVKITLASGNADIIKIGRKSAVTGQYFFNVNDGEIYTLSSYKVDDLLKDADYYTSFSRLELAAADIYDIRIERSNRNNIHLVQTNTADTYNVWSISEPYSKTYSAIDQYVQDKILTSLDGFSVSELAKDGNTGLKSPKAVLTLKSAPVDENGNRGAETVTVLKIGNTAGNKTYVEYEGTAYEVSADKLSFVDTDEFLIVSKLLALVPIQNLNSMSIASGSDTYKLEISHSNIGADDDEMSFSINGTGADEKKSKTAYQQVIGLSADGIYKGEPLGDTIAEIMFDSTDGKKTVTFKSINEMSASFTIDGVTEFTVKKSSINNMLSQISEFAQNPLK